MQKTNKSLEEQERVHIDRILSNNTKRIVDGKTKPLSAKQLNTLKKYYADYSSKPSNRGGKISISTIRYALCCLQYLGQTIQKPYESMKKEDLIHYVKTLHKDGYKVHSISTNKAALRIFFKWLYGKNKKGELPEVFDDPLLMPENVLGKKEKKTIPSKEDIIKLVNAAPNNKEKAMIMILAEGGLREGELASLNVGSVEFDEHGCKIWIEKSKSKRRYERFIEAAPFIQQWLQEHPKSDDKNAPLFFSYRHSEYGKFTRLLPKASWFMIDRIKKQVPELKNKKLYPHLLRHYAVTTRWREGMRSETNAQRHGITMNTLQNVYLHYDDSDADSEYIELHDEKPDPEKLLAKDAEKKKLLPKKCSYCHTLNPFNNKYCKHCNKPVDLNTFVELDKQAEAANYITSLIMQKAKEHRITPEQAVDKLFAK